MSNECNEGTYKQIKDIRSKLNKDFNAMEEKRKEVKRKILAPYEEFETVYKSCITDIFKPAEKQLSERIATVENGLKEQKRTEVQEYFTEYSASKNIDFLTFADMDLNITLNASKKSLKEKVKVFVDKVYDDLSMIDTQEHKAEILVEYKKSLNISQAILTVTNRIKAIEEEKQKSEEAKIVAEQKAATIANVDKAIEETISAPTVLAAPSVDEIAEEPITSERTKYVLSFKVSTYDIGKLRRLKNFMESEGIEYEQL